MSIIALTIAPLIAGDDDWETATYGIIPLAVMLIGTFTVYWFFWRNHEGIQALPGSTTPRGSNKDDHKDDSYSNSGEDTPLTTKDMA
jgi:hypothetical protein